MGTESVRVEMPNCGMNNDLMTAMMANGGCGMNGIWNNPFFYLIWMAMFRNGGMFGNDQNGVSKQVEGLQNTMNSQATNGLIMDAIKGDAAATADLANQLGCSTQQLSNALCGINNNITSMGYQNQLNNCQQTNAINQNFAQLGYNLAEQSCQTRQAIKDNTLAVTAKIDAVEDSRKDREISTLTAALATANARAERQAELAPIIAQLNSISSKQPSTVSVQYPQLSVYPSYLNNAYTGGTTWG